ncbi:MAG: arginine--tRNA ligase [Sphingobacteriia bacterium]|nr:arginine--tRNA ligase [Sphingobacteriia bacterium]
MNIFEIFKSDILKIASNLDNITTSDKFTIEKPKEESFGDLATNVAIVSAKQNERKPIELANLYAQHIEKLPYVKNIKIDGPGFINIFLKNDILIEILKSIIDLGTDYGNSNLGKGVKVNVEYVSVNPTGPMHIGHARCAAYGDSLAVVLKKAGFDVTKEYYINDAGQQINILAGSAYLRYLEALGENITIPDGLYPGDYLIEVGQNLKEQHGEKLKQLSENERMAIIKPFAVSEMMKLIRKDLNELGIYHDIFTSELKITEAGLIENSIKLLEKSNLLYNGTLEKPKGKTPDDWEEKEQLIFKSTEFGDDMDRVVKKSDGNNTYFAGDLGYTLDKINRKFDQLIYVLGADHVGYIKRLKSIASALSNQEVSCDVKICQLVNFMENGEALKMSKRAGTYITVKDVIDLVGSDVIRIMMLTRKNDIGMNFDIAKVKEQSKDNPVFYIQYAHARAKSVIRQAKEEHESAFKLYKSNKYDLALLNSEEEQKLIKILANWPKILEQAAIHHEPHRVIFYAMEVASEFHSLWAKGKEKPELKFLLKDNINLTTARLALMEALANVVASTLQVCNVEALEQM